MTLYFVECDFGKLGRAFIETSRDSNSRTSIVSDIASSQIENVVRVLEVIEDEGTCHDVTEDIAREVFGEVEAELNKPIPGYLRDFIDSNLGAGVCDEYDAEIAA